MSKGRHAATSVESGHDGAQAPEEIVAAAERLARLRPRDPDEQDRVSEMILALLRRAGAIVNARAYVKRLSRIFRRRKGLPEAAPRSVRPFVNRVVWAQRRLYHSVALNRDEGGRPRWRDPNDVDEDLVVLIDALRAAATPAGERPELTRQRVKEVREALRHRKAPLDSARDEPSTESAGAVLTAEEIGAIDDTLGRSTLAAHERKFIATVLFAYSLHGPRSTTIVAEQASGGSKTALSPGAIEWRFHGLMSRLQGEAITWCRQRADLDEGVTWVFSSFESAAALDAATAPPERPKLDPAKALALIGQHLGLSNAEIMAIGPWNSPGAVGVRLNQAREVLGRPSPAPAGCAFELPPVRFLRTVVTPDVVERVAGFAPRAALRAAQPHQERLDFLAARWFARAPHSGARGLPMPNPTDGAPADDVVHTIADWWNEEGARAHLSPAELRLSFSSSADRARGPLTARVADHLATCPACRASRTALVALASRGDEEADGALALGEAVAPAPSPGWFDRLRAWLSGERGAPARRWPALLAGVAVGMSILLPAALWRGRGESLPLGGLNDGLVDAKGGVSGFSSVVWCLSGGKSPALSSGDQCRIGAFLKMRVSLPAREPGALSVLMCRSRPSQCRFVSGPSSPIDRKAVELYWPVEGPREKVNLVVLWSPGAPDKARIEKNLDRSPDRPQIAGVLQGLPRTQGIVRTFEITSED
jgi:hypothetical protein